MSEHTCVRCLLREMAGSDYEGRIGRFVAAIKDEDRADEELVNQRLEICRQCEKLNAGTCLKCGCYVEIRAALMRGRCPAKKW